MFREFGFDYGTKPRLMLVADYSYGEYFSKAKCLGLVYMHCPDSGGKDVITEFGFNFEVEEFGNKFIDCLLRWVKDSGNDGNAVDIEFIELLNDDYLVAVAPNMERFIKRMVPPNLESRIDPIMTMLTQGKGGMRISKHYEDFKKQYADGRRIPVRAYFSEKGKIMKGSETYFVKTEFKFSKEGELPNYSLGKALLAKRDKPFNPKNQKSKKPVPKAAIEKRRLEELHYFYPVLMDKIEHEGWLSEIIATIPSHIPRPEILQAICNIVLLERLKQNNSVEVKTSGIGYDMDLLKYLLGSVENFGSYFPDQGIFTKASIKKQAKLDKEYLTDYLQKS